MSDHQTYWFRAKRYGWGWGLPARWQGWVVLVSYLALLYAGIYYVGLQHNEDGAVVYVGVLTAVFLAIVVIKGERPVRWRWGGK